MNTNWWCVGAALAAMIGLWPGGACGQLVDHSGSTAQGDALLGQGRFLSGMAWYELESAQAAAINEETQAAWNRSVQAGYNQYLLDRARRAGSRRSAITARMEKVEKTLAETQRRWRENPTQDEIRSGLALNALASDLADPAIPVSSWGQARVELPKEFSLPSVVFRFARSPRSRLPLDLSPSVVAIARMKGDEGWPVPLRRPDLNRDRDAYERAVKAAIARCAKGQRLQAADVDRLRDGLVSLKERAAQVVPSGAMLKQAVAYLDRLDEATRLFLDQEFAEELIRDVETHRAGTVGELLAFMKKYRLLFAEGGDDPAVWATYEKLHELLKSQKLALDFADVAEKAAEEKKAREKQR
jgi:hypothetical protein